MYRIAVANNKGGVGKTTTSVALASLLSGKGPTLLVDADEMTKGTLDWASAGPGLPCDVLALTDLDGADLSGYQYVVLDTKAGEQPADLIGLAQDADLLIVPTKPDAVSVRALVRTLTTLVEAGVQNYRVLIVDVPPAPNTDGQEARMSLLEQEIPVFNRDVRRATAFGKAALAGTPVGWVRKDRYARSASLDYELVLNEILKGVQA